MNAPTHHDRDDIEGRLGRRLRSTPIELPSAPGPHVAVDRAQQRSRRRRSSLVAVAAFALVGGVAGPMLLGDDPDEGVNTDVASPIDANGVELDWQVHEDGLSMVQSADEGADGFYALSTAPGTRWQDFPDGNVPRSLYRFEDGAWAPISLDDDDPRVAKLSTRDGVLYSLSTAAQTGEPVGSFSTDGGQTWSTAALGAITPPSESVPWEMSVRLDIASTASTTIAVVGHHFAPPTPELFAGEYAAAEDSWYHTRAGAEGVELVKVTVNDPVVADPEGVAGSDSPSSTALPHSTDDEPRPNENGEIVEVVRVVPWAELGVSGPDDLTSKTTTYRVDAGEWTPIDERSGPLGSTIAMTATEDAILWHTGDESGTHVRYTTDGESWHDVATPSATWGMTHLAPNGHLLHVSDDPRQDDAVSISTDLGATWAPVDFGSVDPTLEDLGQVFFTAHSGPLGVAVLAHSENGPSRSGRLLFSTDLQSWSVTDLEPLTPDETPVVSYVSVGTDRLILHLGGTGDVRDDLSTPGAPSDPDDGEPGPSATLVATPIR